MRGLLLVVLVSGCGDQGQVAEVVGLRAQAKALAEEVSALRGELEKVSVSTAAPVALRQWCRTPALASGCPTVSDMMPAEKIAKPGQAEALCRDYVGAPKCLVSWRYEYANWVYPPAPAGTRVLVIYRVDAVL